MSNFSLSAPTTLIGLVQSANGATGNALGPVLILLILIIQLSAFSFVGFKKSIVLSLSNTLLMAILFVVIGILSINIMFMLLISLVGASIWLWVSES